MIFRLIGAATLSGVFVLALTSCATAYRGPSPDFSLKGEARTTEIEKFSLTEGFFNQAPGQFMMGSGQQPYFTESLLPIVRDVSPRAVRRIDKAKVWHRIAQGGLLLATVILISEFTDGDDRFLSHEQAIAYWSGLGISLSASFVRAQQLNRAAHEYNEDLRTKFSPSVAMTFSY